MSKKQRLLSTLILAQLYSALTIDVNDLACCDLALEKVWWSAWSGWSGLVLENFPELSP